MIDKYYKNGTLFKVTFNIYNTYNAQESYKPYKSVLLNETQVSFWRSIQLRRF